MKTPNRTLTSDETRHAERGRDRFLEARARRVGRRVEALCEDRVPGCRVATSVRGGSGTFDLSLGAAGAEPGERAWARDLDPSTLSDEAAVERLASFLAVWVEPDPASIDRDAAGRRSAGDASARPRMTTPGALATAALRR